MRRPSFQFYPADWRNNANLRRCSPAARGIWVDVMCVLHDSDEYGVVRWPLLDLASAANAPIKLVRELVEKNVLKGGDKAVAAAFVYVPRSGRKNGNPVTLVPIQAGPVWFSSRMVKDEYVRTIRGESTRFGDDQGEAPKHSPKPPISDGSTTSSSTSLNTSVPIGTGGKPPLITNPDEIIFVYGLNFLMNAGTPEKNARSFLGGLRKHHGDEALIDKLRECVKAKPLQPLEWLAAALPPGGATAKPGKHAGFQNLDYAKGVNADGTFN